MGIQARTTERLADFEEIIKNDTLHRTFVEEKFNKMKSKLSELNIQLVQLNYDGAGGLEISEKLYQINVYAKEISRIRRYISSVKENDANLALVYANAAKEFEDDRHSSTNIKRLCMMS